MTDQIAKLLKAYTALRDFDAAMDIKYNRDLSCNRLDSLTLDEAAECRRLGINRDFYARTVTEKQYGEMIDLFNKVKDAEKRADESITKQDEVYSEAIPRNTKR